MIEKFCGFIVEKMKKQMPDIDEERGEVINYGLQLCIGELPKIILLFVLGFILGIGWLTVFTFIILLPYRISSGGFHLKSHIGCMVCTIGTYIGIVYFSKYITIEPQMVKYVFTFLVWIVGLLMVNRYAPADTENVPILSTQERKRKKLMSYITLTLTLIASAIIQNDTISNILLYGVLLQTFSITRVAYKITNNKYGYEEYQKTLITE